MDIRNRLYPYPVLCEDTDDYLNSCFSIGVEGSIGIREIIFSFTLALQNPGLEELIRQERAEYLIHIECPQTCYREIVTPDGLSYEKHIPEKELNGKVSICAFIVAKQDLKSYTNADFNPDYQGVTFDIERGSILAIGGQFNTSIVKDTEELGKIPSIFSIIHKADDEDGLMSVNLDSQKIAVCLPKESFRIYSALSKSSKLMPVFHAMVIVPALIYVFETLRREDMEIFRDYRWFIGIQKALEKQNVKLDRETLENTLSIELAQKLLDRPMNRAMEGLGTVGSGEEEEE